MEQSDAELPGPPVFLSELGPLLTRSLPESQVPAANKHINDHRSDIAMEGEAFLSADQQLTTEVSGDIFTYLFRKPIGTADSEQQEPPAARAWLSPAPQDPHPGR